MKKDRITLGVDVSKKTLDICHWGTHDFIKIENNSSGFKQLAKWMRGKGFVSSQVFFIMEYTGGYEYRFLQYCESKGLSYTRKSGLEIKKSMGMVRGKSDKQDSFRIAQYGEEKAYMLETSGKLNSAIFDLKHLISFRKRLVRAMAGYKASSSERKAMYGKDAGKVILKVSKELIDVYKKEIYKVEREILQLIESDESLNRNYQILKSVKGIGPVNAWMTIVYTENFKAFTDPRKYAVYAGVIPFEHTSGTSIRGRKRVSHMANKAIKQELNQAAKIAITHDKTLREYAQRKLTTKAYPLVLNNVKFKLILIMFSLIGRQEMYREDYHYAA